MPSFSLPKRVGGPWRCVNKPCTLKRCCLRRPRTNSMESVPPTRPVPDAAQSSEEFQIDAGRDAPASPRAASDRQQASRRISHQGRAGVELDCRHLLLRVARCSRAHPRRTLLPLVLVAGQRVNAVKAHLF
ncbi:hypothetical protein MN608_04931 [Microdochium nivale]|nr:hypothetical protein MN608_04931 [Microdochium nivale]